MSYSVWKHAQWCCKTCWVEGHAPDRSVAEKNRLRRWRINSERESRDYTSNNFNLDAGMK